MRLGRARPDPAHCVRVALAGRARRRVQRDVRRRGVGAVGRRQGRRPRPRVRRAGLRLALWGRVLLLAHKFLFGFGD